VCSSDLNRFAAAVRQEGVRPQSREERPRVPRHDDLCMRQERVAHYALKFAGGGGPRQVRQDDGWEQAGGRSRR
jgi:hypothetical protein